MWIVPKNSFSLERVRGGNPSVPGEGKQPWLPLPWPWRAGGTRNSSGFWGHSEQLLAKPWRWEGSAQEGQPHLEGMVRGLSWEGSSSFRSEVRTCRGAVWAWITQELQGVVSRGVPEALEKCFISSCLKDDSKSHFYQNGQFLISFFCCVAASLL